MSAKSYTTSNKIDKDNNPDGNKNGGITGIGRYNDWIKSTGVPNTSNNSHNNRK